MHDQLTDTVTTAGDALPDVIFIFDVYEIGAVIGCPAVKVEGIGMFAAC